MSKKTENNIKSIEEILKEVKELSLRADESTNHQLDLFLNKDLGDEDIDPIIDFSSISDTADPDKSHKLYYGIRRLLIDYLPKGNENKKLRAYVYYEKNLFLKRGLETGADSRMTYIANYLEVAFKVVTNWVLHNSNPYDIYMEFYNLNEESGYHTEKQKLSNFDLKLKEELDFNSKEKE